MPTCRNSPRPFVFVSNLRVMPPVNSIVTVTSATGLLVDVHHRAAQCPLRLRGRGDDGEAEQEPGTGKYALHMMHSSMGR